MNFKFKESKIIEIKEFMDNYVSSLRSPIDSFMEGYIVKSQFYKIKLDEKIVGYFAIYKNDLLTQFYLTDDCKHLAQDVFFLIKRFDKIKAALFQTSDEFFLTLAMDSYKNLELKGYVFQDAKRSVTSRKHSNFSMELVQTKDIENMDKECKEFFDDIDVDVTDERIYKALKDDEIVGYGFVEKGNIMNNYASIGMIVNENYRHQGFGRSVILALKDIVYEKGMIPIAGCEYFNHNSKKTLESSGMCSTTRLFKISFN